MKYILSMIGGYIAGWTVCYSLMMEFEYGWYFEYLRLAWTGEGFERVAAMHVCSIGAACISPFVLVAFARARSTRSQAPGDPRKAP